MNVHIGGALNYALLSSFPPLSLFSFFLRFLSAYRCCTLFSAAVIRGIISSNGFSSIRIDLILGGLHREFQRLSNKYHVE